ncbi:MAG: TIGR03086 family metal-binding protein, partial [Actinomycetota bacterium]
LVGGLTIAEVGDRLEGDLLGLDPKGAWRTAAAEATGACEPEGAMERTVHISAGPAPAKEYLRERVADLTIHAWDLARALGVDEQLDAELVAVSLDLYREKGDLWRQWGLLGPAVAVPPGAGAQEVFVAETGRRP